MRGWPADPARRLKYLRVLGRPVPKRLGSVREGRAKQLGRLEKLKINNGKGRVTAVLRRGRGGRKEKTMMLVASRPFGCQRAQPSRPGPAPAIARTHYADGQPRPFSTLTDDINEGDLSDSELGFECVVGYRRRRRVQGVDLAAGITLVKGPSGRGCLSGDAGPPPRMLRRRRLSTSPEIPRRLPSTLLNDG